MSVGGMVRTWGEMVKFSHSVFALPFALIGMFAAGRHRPERLPSVTQVLLILLCMISARSFAMTFNRIVDADIDARNPRTESRPIPAGRISPRQAWVFTACWAVLFVVGCAGFFMLCDNRWPLLLAAPTLACTAAYSYTKRFTVAAHFVLGAIIAFAPTAAWIAIHPASLGLPAILLTAGVMFWIAGFDIIYACQDVEVDRRERLFTIPSAIGIRRALWVSRTCHFFTIVLLAALGSTLHLGWIYAGGLAIVTALLAAEQFVVRPNDLSRVNLAFFTLNGCVSLLFGLTAISDLLMH
jgi:4-hydroxybenzoate polyprenyltransferase